MLLAHYTVISRKVNTQLECKIKIGGVYGEGLVGDEMCPRWFAKFQPKISHTKVPHRSGRPLAVQSHRVQMFTEDRPHHAMWETDDILKVSRSSVKNHMHLQDYSESL